MSNYISSDPSSTVWINKHEKLPGTCITCGMFTDHSVTVRFTEQSSTHVPGAKQSNSTAALGCLLGLLGPIGWILAAILQSGAEKGGGQLVEKTVTQKGKIKVPCCKLCAGQRMPVALNGYVAQHKYEFAAHPRFIERLTTTRADVKIDADENPFANR